MSILQKILNIDSTLNNIQNYESFFKVPLIEEEESFRKTYNSDAIRASLIVHSILKKMSYDEIQNLDIQSIMIIVNSLRYLNGLILYIYVSIYPVDFICEISTSSVFDIENLFEQLSILEGDLYIWIRKYGKDLSYYLMSFENWKDGSVKILLQNIETLFIKSRNFKFSHGDSKPHNISVDSDGTLRWFDLEFSFIDNEFFRELKTNPYFYIDQMKDKFEGLWFDNEYNGKRNYRKNTLAGFKPFDTDKIINLDQATFCSYMIYSYNKYFNALNMDEIYLRLNSRVIEYNISTVHLNE
jgi:hypothetical protein